MAEGDRILSQHEVDALLSAIDSGEVEVTPEPVVSSRAVPYDFRRPERVGRDQLRAIETLHEAFARSLHTALSGLVRAVVDVRVVSVDQLTYLEFVNSLPNPTVYTVFSAEPLEGSFILELNPSIAFPLYERLAGSGKVGAAQPERPLTQIEWKLIEGNVLGRALDLLREAWAGVIAVTPRLRAREANPQLVQVLSPNEAVVSVVLEITMGEQKGYLDLGLPVVSIEVLLEKIASPAWFAGRRKDAAAGQEAALTRQLAPAEVRVAAHLPADPLRLKDLESLRKGDIIVTNHPASAPVMVSVEGRPKFWARAGSHRERKAVKIVGPLDPVRGALEAGPRAPVTVRHQGAGGRPGVPPAPEAGVVAHLLEVPLTASVVLAEKTLPLKDVLALRVGQVLEFSRRVDEPLPLRAGDRPLAEGSAVKLGDRFGLEVTAAPAARDAVAALGP